MQVVSSRPWGFVAWVLVVLIGGSSVVASQTRRSPTRVAAPDCTGRDRYQAVTAFVHLKNAGLTDNAKIDFTKTKVTRLASEKVSARLFRQVHRVVFTEHSGKQIEVITVNDVSFEECSETSFDVFVVSQHFSPVAP